MEAYVTIIQELEKKVSEATRKFEERLVSSASFRSRTRTINLAKAAMTLLKESDGRVVGLPRTSPAARNWWQIFVHERFPEEQCLEHLKCSRKTYIWLVKALRPHIKPRPGAGLWKQNLETVCSVSVEKQVAVTLHKLVRCTDYSAAYTMFGIQKSTVQKIFHKVVKAINNNILQSVVKMPKCDEAFEIAKQLQTLSRIPQLIGSLESTHIPVAASGKAEFTNSENYSSFILQTIVDPNCCFRDVSVRHPGGADDRRVLEDSSIFRLHERVVPATTQNINDVEVPYKIAASSSYPLLPWLLTEFEPASTQLERTFNDHLRIVRYCSAAALARLKARFVILSQMIDMNYKIAPQIIAACCAIHNICENNGDHFPDEWLEESLRCDAKFPQPARTRNFTPADQRDLQLRDALKDYLEKQLLLDKSSSIHVVHTKN